MKIDHPYVSSQFSFQVLFIVAMIPAIPFLMTQYTDEPWLGATLTFATVLCISGINEVARELENPFRNIPNELPLVTIQAQANEALYTMFAGYHPDLFWDGDRALRNSRRTDKLDFSMKSDVSSKGGDMSNKGYDNELSVPLQSRNGHPIGGLHDVTESSTASISPDSSEGNVATQSSTSQQIGHGEIEELKRQLAAQAKLIEQLTSKIGNLSNQEVADM